MAQQLAVAFVAIRADARGLNRDFSRIERDVNRRVSRLSRIAEFTFGAYLARGLFQITEDTWYDVEPTISYEGSVFNPEINSRAGMKYLVWLDKYLKSKNDNWGNLDEDEKRTLVLAAYNSGPNRLRLNSWDLKKMPRETQNHVETIMGRLNDKD